ncbi:hypothetical protein [Fodinibius sediminis]|uniref:Uncharacterized protein n=1 Tax=Fodinibius sediminis TaxID=1214077 RepID=A0A521ELZ7_9BACT|nr:hypothetical protein [Fodinibius sediminis]SMO84471.1 hypothetical protein SAMN06265218_11713 [Fodinibius sediminis]
MLFTKMSLADFPWKMLLLEGLLVVLSVLLALALNSWREARTHQNLADRALQEVMDEAQINCARIESVQSYHRAVVNGSQKPTGLKIGFLRNDAWDVAKTTGAASYLDYQLASRIGEISAHQSDHRSIVRAYTEALFTNGLQLEPGQQMHQQGEQGVINELLRIQEKLLTKYQSLQELLNEQHNSAIATPDVCGNG